MNNPLAVIALGLFDVVMILHDLSLLIGGAS